MQGWSQIRFFNEPSAIERNFYPWILLHGYIIRLWCFSCSICLWWMLLFNGIRGFHECHWKLSAFRVQQKQRVWRHNSSKLRKINCEFEIVNARVGCWHFFFLIYLLLFSQTCLVCFCFNKWGGKISHIQHKILCFAKLIPGAQSCAGAREHAMIILTYFTVSGPRVSCSHLVPQFLLAPDIIWTCKRLWILALRSANCGVNILQIIFGNLNTFLWHGNSKIHQN